MEKRSDEIRRHSEEMAAIIVKHINKYAKKAGKIIPAARVLVFASLLDDAREEMLTAGYSLEAFNAWVDWGERWATAAREGRGLSKGDDDALQKAYRLHPSGGEGHIALVPTR